MKLEKLWEKVFNAISKLQQSPDSLEELRSGTAKVRSNFHDYQVVWLSYVDFLAYIGTPQCQQERETWEGIMKNHKQFVQTTLSQGGERKKEFLLEMGSWRSRGSRASSVSFAAVRTQARAEAAAAVKKAEMQKKRSFLESQSALLIQQQELALTRRKMNEQARIESLRLEEEAAVAVTKANAINDELGFRGSEEAHRLDLPEENASQRVQHYFQNQCIDPFANHQDRPLGTNQTTQQDHLQSHQIPPPQPLDPTADAFSPPNQMNSPPNPNPVMKSYIEFMARRELIANKIEKFDDSPENYHTWKESFKNMTRNVSISPSEELSLIIEYTSKNSKKLVQRLRNAYITNSAEGVVQVWKKLGERYGSNAVLTKVHLNKLTDFPKIGYKDSKKLQELGDLLLELECAKKDGSLQGLRILDEPIYLKPILTKLPEDIQTRWQYRAFRYKRDHHVDYPPFVEFAKFIQDISLERNDPNLAIDTFEKDNPSLKNPTSKPRQSYKTEITDGTSADQKNRSPDLSNWCIIHQKPHPLNKCRAFRAKPFDERKNLLRQHRICFRCVASSTHMSKDCKCTVKCTECQSEKHLAALHAGTPPESKKIDKEVQGQSEERNDNQRQHGSQEEVKQQGEEPNQVTSACTEICGNTHGGKSCSKICLANVYVENQPNTKIQAYVVIDDQSNCSLAKSQLFEQLNLDGETSTYTLKTCAGLTPMEGRHAKGLVIESLDGRKTHLLPTIIECNAIPDSKEEIPTPTVAMAHPHLRSIADKIPEVRAETEILLLIGRDVPPLHKVHESRNGRGNAPWAQRLDLGWVILGNACLDGAHKPNDISSFKAHVLHSGRPSILQPCPNVFHVKQDSSSDSRTHNGNNSRRETFVQGKFQDGLADNVFVRTKNDNEPGLSMEDRRFVNIMERNMVKNSAGNWVAPLPFRHDVTELPINREEAYKRLKSTRRTLDRKPLMKHYFDFMQKIFDNEHAELVPPKDCVSAKPCWYLPHFGVYHPQKPEKIRVVFDSAAETDGVSLNKLLLSGSDFTNSLLGVLLRFRQNSTAFMADIEQMFYSLIVKEDHRDFLRFLWYKDNNPDGEVVEYRMKVHLFGNTSSPAVATFGLRKTALVGETEFGSYAKEFVVKNFYVDDGLKSTPESERAIDLLRCTQAMLATAHLRLHKIASNDPKVTQAFPSEDRASGLRDLDMNQNTTPIQRSLGVCWDLETDTFQNTTPIQRSLGVCWDLETDTFTFRVTLGDKPFTRRGVLSVINSLYDPLGIAAPVVIRGKILLRSMSTHLKDRLFEEWAKPLPQEYKPAWQAWCESLSDLQHLKIPRAYATASLEQARRTELHTFCDASVQGIAAVSYLKTVQPNGQVEVSFVLGKAKLVPSHATTIPRLELCAAVLGVEITELILEEEVVQPDSITYYSDSKVVLGYVTNETRRFYVYVTNRVERIRKSSSAEQWRYVPTHLNPADLATRSVKASDLGSSRWLTGPKFLYDQNPTTDMQVDSATVETSTDDPEVRLGIKILSTTVQTKRFLGSSRFSRFSQWKNLVKAVSRLIMFAQSHHRATLLNDSNLQTPENPTAETAIPSVVNTRKQAETVTITNLQHEAFGEDIERSIKNEKKLARTSGISKLSPIIDIEGLLRVGGRLDGANLTNEERHPLILPGSHHVTTLIVEHLHNEVKHQGRHFTHGIVRAKGYWIVGGKRLVSKVIHRCLKCKKLRGKAQHQKMADLLAQRLTPVPPFTYVGLDVFGPWQVMTRRTRGGAACNKRWAVIFTCLTIRAIHIELIESLDTSSFINALRRFLAIRGPVAQLRSDCGTNFVGARNELAAALKEMNTKDIEAYLNHEGSEWIFNPPHASHAGGV